MNRIGSWSLISRALLVLTILGTAAAYADTLDCDADKKVGNRVETEKHIRERISDDHDLDDATLKELAEHALDRLRRHGLPTDFEGEIKCIFDIDGKRRVVYAEVDGDDMWNVRDPDA